jgi:hypothetical protein
MQRPSGQSAIGNMVPPAARSLNANYANNYIVRAKNQSESAHGGKRVLITYIYLCVLRDLSIRGALPIGRAQHVGMTLQAKGGHGQNQGAHQILGELTVGGRHIYLLLGLNQLERRTVIYCTSAVSVLDKTYNHVDNYIEKAGRDGYINLANRILIEAQAGRSLSNRVIWSGVIAIFKNALTRARSEIKASNRSAELPLKERMIRIVDDHIIKIDSFGARQAQFIALSADTHMRRISEGAF